MSKHTLSAVVLALPRLELPFLMNWAYHLERLGVTQLFLYQDNTDKMFWNKKPNPKWYHPHLSHDEVWGLWQEEIVCVQEFMDVVCIDVNTDDYPDEPRYISAPVLHVQDDMFKDVTKRTNGWVLNCDIDEYLHSANGLLLKNYLPLVPVSGVYFRQYVFESRLTDEGVPINATDIKRYDPRLIDKGKFVYDTERNNPETPHYLTQKEDTMFADPDDFVILHYRGKQIAKSKAIGEPKFTAEWQTGA